MPLFQSCPSAKLLRLAATLRPAPRVQTFLWKFDRRSFGKGPGRISVALFHRTKGISPLFQPSFCSLFLLFAFLRGKISFLRTIQSREKIRLRFETHRSLFDTGTKLSSGFEGKSFSVKFRGVMMVGAYSPPVVEGCAASTWHFLSGNHTCHARLLAFVSALTNGPPHMARRARLRPDFASTILSLWSTPTRPWLHPLLRPSPFPWVSSL